MRERHRMLVVAVGATLAGASLAGTLRMLHLLHDDPLAATARAVDAAGVAVAVVPPERGTLTLAAAGAVCSRLFRVGDRADFQSSVRDAFGALGLCEHRAGELYHVYFGEQLPPSAVGSDPYLHPLALVNTVPGLRGALGEKGALARLHSHCLDSTRSAHGGRLCDFSERSFEAVRHRENVSVARRDEFVAHNRAMPEPWPHFWIVKPTLSYNGLGIRLAVLREADVASEQSLSLWMRANLRAGHFVLQSYVRFPLLYGGGARARKFDLRIWCLLSSADPLRLLLLATAFPKVASEEYNGAAEYVHDDCMHFRLPSAPHCRGALVHPYPSSTASPHFGRNVRFPDGRPLVWEELLPAIERVLTTVVLLARTATDATHAPQSILQADAELRARASCRFQKRFAFLAPDLLIRADGTVSLVELNTNGFMSVRKPLAEMQPFTEAALRLLGASGYPRHAAYNGSLEAALGRFCARRRPPGCSDDDAWALRELVHERRHAHGGWYPIFPTAEAEARRRELAAAGAPVELTPRDECTRDFVQHLLEQEASGRALLAGERPRAARAETRAREGESEE